ncbi:MAG: CPBP family intramembrane glutamic endopeptidase, partial [Rikenellaceae bacterium]
GASLIYRHFRCHSTLSPCLYKRKGVWNPNYILLGMVLMVAISVVIDPLSRFFAQDMSSYIQMFTTGNMWVTLLVTVIIAPFLEEIFFRGILLHDISICWGPRWGIVISSLLFSAFHFNLIQAIPAFLMGLVMGYIYMQTRRGLTNVIILHIINNLMASVSLYWGFGEVSVWERYLPAGFWHNVVYAVSALLVMFLVVRIATLSVKIKEE